MDVNRPSKHVMVVPFKDTIRYLRAYSLERHGVDQEVRNGAMQKDWCDQPVPLPVRQDVCADHRACGEHTFQQY